ncbi:MAG: proteobacterial dedicated sortase system histidine kinase [gamma proteobacterium symbiont of Bathyaustriella thionipta]|nr:proteobacterial dedicated sortase system histidine kinase [gamma proteobacterium symbiont of Bathyaustriella thionipta]
MAAHKRRFYHSIGFKLLLLTPTLFAIPWAGYLYIEETESFLQRAQQSLLMNQAQAVAMLLHHRSDWFDQPIELETSRHDYNTIHAHRLQAPIQLDGYTEDWYSYERMLRHYGQEHALLAAKQPSLSFEHMAGVWQQHLYVLFKVHDDQLVYRKPGSRRLDQNDHLIIVLETPQGERRRYLLATSAPGWVSAFLMPNNKRKHLPLSPEVRIKGEWQETGDGYTLEIRLPLSMFGSRLGFAIADVDDPQSRQIEAIIGTTGSRTIDDIGLVITPNPEIERVIDSIEHENARIWVLNRNGRVLAQRGQLQFQPRQDKETATPFLSALYRLILRQPKQYFDDDLQGSEILSGSEVKAALAGHAEFRRRQSADKQAVIVSAAWPVKSGKSIIGAVLVEQSTNQILSLQNHALERLFTFTLGLFALTALLLLGFATRLARRIRALRNKINQSVSPDGRIIGQLQPARSKDEIGDLQRSFASVLTRLSEYNDYLEKMASRMAHELRTPLAVVKSSLENLSLQQSDAKGQVYIHRALQGSERLSLIIQRLREASRLEQLISQAQPEALPLGDFMRTLCSSYQASYPQVQFNCQEISDMRVLACADLLAQALDKLIENAIDFHAEGSEIQVQLQQQGSQAAIRIINHGPALPAGPTNDLFTSMVSLRKKTAEEPHLGLGLYLVKLIAEFHQGSTHAENLANGHGVRIGIDLPLST